MSGLTLVVLQFALLLVLWLMIFGVVAAMRRDSVIGKKVRTGVPTARQVRKHPELGEEPVRQHARTLSVLEGPMAGTELPLVGQPIMLGRAAEADLILDDDYASGRHARLFPQGSRWFIEDLGSTNGTYVADQQLTRALPLDIGVPVRIGKTVIELRP